MSSILLIIPILLAILPGLIALTVIAKRKLRLWLDACLGGGGWILALVLRLPILQFSAKALNPTYSSLLAAFMAGIFEETFRYLVLKYRLFSKGNPCETVLSLGLGWGLTEAFLIYALQVPLSYAITGYDWTVYLPGAFERNIAIILHVALTFIIAYSLVSNIKYIVLAVFLHGTVNSLIIPILYVTKDPWIIELLLALITVPIATCTIIVLKPKISSIKQSEISASELTKII